MKLLYQTIFVLSVLSLFSVQIMAAEEAEILIVRPEKFGQTGQTKSGAEIRDPFNWPSEQIARFKAIEKQANKEDPFAGLSLEGIIWNSRNPLAIINGKLMGVGDLAGEVTIKEIKRESVNLAYKGKRHQLNYLAPDSEPEFEHLVQKKINENFGRFFVNKTAK